MVVSIREQLAAYQAKLLTKISAAANAADTNTLLSLNDELRRTATLLSQMDHLGIEAQSLLGLASAGNATIISSVQSRVVSKKVAGRGHGVQIRSDFLDRAVKAGFQLRPHRGATYLSPNGRRIGVAVATERKPNRWFLGLGEDSFDAAVLLCMPDKGRAIEVCLPPSFFTQHGRYLSRAGGQVKFNTARRDGHIILKVPRMNPERVDEFVGNFAGLDR